MKLSANKALHRTTNPLHSIAAGELHRSAFQIKINKEETLKNY